MFTVLPYLVWISEGDLADADRWFCRFALVKCAESSSVEKGLTLPDSIRI